MQTMPNAEEQQQYGISRVLSFSDGVFGFAITLLIVNVISAFPSLPTSATDEQLRYALFGFGPSFFSYAFSFYMVGVYWVAHHRMFVYIINYTNALLWLNLTMLLFVVFLPFSTSLLDKYNNSNLIVAFYAATLTTISVCSILLWEYAVFRHRLIPPDLDYTGSFCPFQRVGFSQSLACKNFMVRHLSDSTSLAQTVAQGEQGSEPFSSWLDSSTSGCREEAAD